MSPQTTRLIVAGCSCAVIFAAMYALITHQLNT